MENISNTLQNKIKANSSGTLLHIPLSISEKIIELIAKSRTIVIISHRSPDADTIGSNLALREILEKYGKKVISACMDHPPEGIGFLKGADCFQKNFNPAEIDLIISVDAGSLFQIAFADQYLDLFSGKVPFINIDHHASNNHYAKINLVLPEAASTTLVLYFLFQLWQEPITSDIATALLYGLYYDTGSFMHSNTDDEVYEVASTLLKCGARLEPIIKNLFHTHSIQQLKLWGKVFSEAQLTRKNIILSGITYHELQKAQTKLSDLSGAIDYLSMVPGNLFAALLSEDGKGNIRASLRTKRDDVNLSEIASTFGGGGHKKASGFTMPGSFQKETYWTIKH